MVDELRVTRRPDGTHRPKSKSDPTADRDMLFTDDGNALDGITESWPATREDADNLLGYPLESPQPAEEKPGILDTFNELLQLINDEGVPMYINHVRPWLQRRNAARAAKGPGRRYAEDSTEPATAALATEAVIAEPVSELDVVKEPIAMTREQFQQSVLITLAAQRWAAQRTEVLSRATIVDDPVTPQVRAAINLVLAGKVDQLDSEMTTLLSAFFRKVRLLDAEGRLLPELLQRKVPD